MKEEQIKNNNEVTVTVPLTLFNNLHSLIKNDHAELYDPASNDDLKFSLYNVKINFLYHIH